MNTEKGCDVFLNQDSNYNKYNKILYIKMIFNSRKNNSERIKPQDE